MGDFLHPSSLHSKDTRLLNTFMNNSAYKPGTVKNYISSFRQYYQYAISNGYSPWKYDYDIKYWCYYLLWRVRKYSISVLKNSRRGISFIFIDLLGYTNNIFSGAYYDNFIRKINKVYQRAPDTRLPILVCHHIEFAKYYKVNRYNAWTIDIDMLLIVIIDQLYGFAGRRCGEIISNTNPITLDQITIGSRIKYQYKWYNIGYIKIIHHKYKNQLNFHDYMFSVFGETGHKYIDPYFYLSVYLYRREFKKLPATSSAFIFKNGKLFKYNDLNNKIINIYDKHIYDALLNGKINIHGLRIGLNVSMEERGFTQGQISDFITQFCLFLE